MTNALLLVAHGSRRPQSNDEIRTLTRHLRTHADNRFDTLECAFLELAEPSIVDGIIGLADAGAQCITVLPYFLADGRHVHEDIPAQVASAQQQRPHADIVIAPYLGLAPTLPDLLLQHAVQNRTVGA